MSVVLQIYLVSGCGLQKRRSAPPYELRLGEEPLPLVEYIEKDELIHLFICKLLDLQVFCYDELQSLSKERVFNTACIILMATILYIVYINSSSNSSSR